MSVITHISIIFLFILHTYSGSSENLQHPHTFEKETQFGWDAYSCVRNVLTKQVYLTEL